MKRLLSLAALIVLSTLAQTAAADVRGTSTSAHSAIESSQNNGAIRFRIAGYQTLSYSVYLYMGQSMEVEGWGLGTSDVDMFVTNPFGGEAANDQCYGDEFFDSVYAWHTGVYTIYIQNIDATSNVITMVLR